MRNLVLSFVLAAAAALPAVASDQSYRLDLMTQDWAQTDNQSMWVDEPAPAEPIYGHPLDAAPALRFAYTGGGWGALDGWMRGDPTLRHWVMFRFDLDADGALTPSEATAARRAFYEIADLNRSDRITSEEFVTGWMAAREELRGFYGDVYPA